MYVRKGGQPGPLAAPYSGPYKVIDKGPQVLHPRHRRAATGGNGGPPQAQNRHRNSNAGGTAGQGVATGGRAASHSFAPQTSQQSSLAQSARDNRRQISQRKTTASKIRPLSELKGLGGAVLYLYIDR